MPRPGGSGGVDRATARAIRALAKAQLKDGSFSTPVSRTRSPFSPTKTYRTTFLPSLLLGALAGADRDDTWEVREGLARWLLTQKGQLGSFNYWSLDSPEAKTMPYPDDLDATACALAGLYLHKPALVDAGMLAKLVRLLVATETQVGGPYQTWLVPKDAPAVWQDVDIAVNANIAWLLRLVAEPLPNLTTFMEAAIREETFHSPYYPDFYPTIYFIARAYQGPLAPELASAILRRRQGAHWGTPLQTALAVTALRRLGHGDTPDATSYLLATQQPDGLWPAESVWLDPGGKRRFEHCGSAPLTTSFVLEALSVSSPKAAPVSPAKNPDNRAEATYQAVWAGAENHFKAMEPAMRRAALGMLGQMQKSNIAREAALLPLYFKKSLQEQPMSVGDPILIALGQANVFGWMAYTIYDNFLDGEGDPLLLPAANVALRASVDCFRQALPQHEPFQTLVDQTFDQIDQANAWELSHCRFEIQGKSVVIGRLPNFSDGGRLAERSLGHGLTPLAVLAAAGHKLDSQQATSIQLAFRHYLIARQLNDDLHDWEDDLRHGQCTFVIATLLHSLPDIRGKRMLNSLMPRLQQEFWHHALPNVCKVMTRHTAAGRRLANASGILTSQNAFLSLFDGLDTSVEHTLNEHGQTLDFLAAYKSKL